MGTKTNKTQHQKKLSVAGETLQNPKSSDKAKTKAATILGTEGGKS